MSARDHLNPRLFDPGWSLTASEQNLSTHQRMGRELATFGDIAVSVPSSVAESVAVTGTIRTQHETGRSQGAFSPGERAGLEKAMGYENYPVYGALRRSPTEGPHYGNVNLHLKPEVKKRSLMYPGDSLNNSRTGVPQTHDIAAVAAGTEQVTDPGGGESYESVDYVEAHILPNTARPETYGPGGASRVPLSDVARASIHEGSLRFDPFAETRDAQRPRNYEVGQQLRQAGLPVEHVLTDVLEQPVLPMSYGKDLPPPGWHGTRKRVVRHENLAGRDRWGSD